MNNAEETTTKTLYIPEPKIAFYNKISFRLFLLFFLPFCTCMGALYFGSEHAQTMAQLHDDFKNLRSDIQDTAHNLALSISEAESLVGLFFITKDFSHQEQFRKNWEIIGRDLRTLQNTVARLDSTSQGGLQKYSNDVRLNLQEFVVASGEIFAKPSANTSQQRLIELSSLRRNIGTNLQAFLNEAKKSGQNSFVQAQKKTNQSYSWFIQFVIFAMSYSFVVTILLSKSIVNRIKQVSRQCQEIAQGNGDLTKRFNLSSNDEIGTMSRYFDLFLDRVQHLVSSTAAAAEQVNASTHQVYKLTSQSVDATNILHKNSALEQLSMDKCQLAVSRLEAEMKTANERVQRTVNLTTEAQGHTHQAVSKTTGAFQAIDQILQRTENVATQIQALSDIALQAKVISINANIEASKAAAGGHLFLSTAAEILHLSTTAQALANDMAAYLNDLKKDIGLGSQLTQSSLDTLKIMITTINAMAGEILEMEKATDKHSVDVALVAEQVAVLTNNINSNAASTQAVSQSSQKLLMESTHLRQLTENLDVLINQSDEEAA